MITEERKSIVSAGSIDEYLTLCQNTIWPSLRASSGRVLCMLNGMIGNPTSHILQMTAYQDLESWQTAQGAWSIERDSLLEKESVRILRSVSSRPKDTITPEDRRPVYGYRRFLISPSDLSEFVTCSEEGIWPRIEKMGASILGMWTPMASSSPLEVVLLTGYNGPAHWEETRFDNRTDEVDGDVDELWSREEALRERRTQLTQETWVEMMKSTDF